jgi:LysR family transcriptional activator of nhaA
MAKLNYHHLSYFWHVAKEGNLTKTAAKLHVSQSALSSQIMQLEETMGVSLFLRTGRKLILTEIGQQTFSYADDIFTKGQELESFLKHGFKPESVTIRIGMLSTMSRNFIESFIEPLLQKNKTKYVLNARGQTNLLKSLSTHQFDLALTNIEVRGTEKQLWQCQLLARQPIAIIGPPELGLSKTFSDKYKMQRWVLPVSESPIRAGFDSFCSLHQFQPDIIAEADDMAMLRLLARDTGAIAVMPEVVVKDELEQGTLVNYLTLPNLYENFYAVTIKRQYNNALVNDLINHSMDL